MLLFWVWGGTKGYRCYDPVSHSLRISRHVVFWEHKFFHEVGKFSMPYFPPFTTLLEMLLSHSIAGDVCPEPSSLEPQSSNAHDVTLLEFPDSVQSEAPAHTSPPALRRSTRVKSLLSYLQDFHCFHVLADLHEPHSYCEASTNPLWQDAM
jgi:hypothetical protein